MKGLGLGLGLGSVGLLIIEGMKFKSTQVLLTFSTFLNPQPRANMSAKAPKQVEQVTFLDRRNYTPTGHALVHVATHTPHCSFLIFDLFFQVSEVSHSRPLSLRLTV